MCKPILKEPGVAACRKTGGSHFIMSVHATTVFVRSCLCVSVFRTYVQTLESTVYVSGYSCKTSMRDISAGRGVIEVKLDMTKGWGEYFIGTYQSHTCTLPASHRERRGES